MDAELFAETAHVHVATRNSSSGEVSSFVLPAKQAMAVGLRTIGQLDLVASRMGDEVVAVANADGAPLLERIGPGALPLSVLVDLFRRMAALPLVGVPATERAASFAEAINGAVALGCLVWGEDVNCLPGVPSSAEMADCLTELLAEAERRNLELDAETVQSVRLVLDGLAEPEPEMAPAPAA